MIETQQRLAPGIHDNHGLTLWHEWMALTAHHRLLEAEWKYERDESGLQLAGPGECLSRVVRHPASETVGNARPRVILGGDGLYTPLAEMDDRHGAVMVGPGRVITSVCPARGNTLLAALAAAKEATGMIGQPASPRKRGRG